TTPTIHAAQTPLAAPLHPPHNPNHRRIPMKTLPAELATLESSLSLPDLRTLAEILDLLAQLCNLNEPLSSPDGLRAAMDLVLQLGAAAGINANWLAWLRENLEQPPVFDIVLALAAYLSSIIEPSPKSSATRAWRNAPRAVAASDKAAPTISLSQWLVVI